MKLTACHLFFLSLVIFALVNSYVSTVTSNPKNTEVPSTHIPNILTNASEFIVFEGANVTFRCDVDELGGLAMTWLKNSEVYFVDIYNVKKDKRFMLLPDNSLHIQNVHMGDSGKYVCQISSTPPIELHHILRVKGAPPVETIPENGILTVTLGEPINIGCKTDDGKGIVWSHSMKKLNEHVKGGFVSIPAAKKEDSGIYECKVDKGGAVSSIGKIEVFVHYSPTIEAPVKLIYAGEGVSAALSCSVFGEPTPKVTWVKNNIRIYPHDNIKIESQLHTNEGHTHFLKVRKVTQYDLGNYTCKAENSLGRASETIEITGLPAPVEFKYDLNYIKPDSYAMKWSVTSHSPINEFKLKFRKRPENDIEYEWTEVYIPAEKHPGPVQTHTYDITGLEPASVYEATIVSRNKFGWNNKSEIFIFNTERVVIGKEDADDAVVETGEPPENTMDNNVVTSSSIADTRTNTDGNKAGGLCWNAQTVAVMVTATMFLW